MNMSILTDKEIWARFKIAQNDLRRLIKQQERKEKKDANKVIASTDKITRKH